MVDTVWAVNAVTGAPAYSGKQERQAHSVAYAGATSARPLGTLTGVRPGTPTTTVSVASFTWTCHAFSGIADVESSAIAAGYEFAFDADATGGVTAANATNPRVDIIYVQIDDPAESDGSTTPAATRKYLAGTAAPSPVPPALPVTRAFVVAWINVPVSGGGSPTVTWVAPYAVAAGGAQPIRTVTERAALAGGSVEGPQYVDRLDLGVTQRAVGSGWSTSSIGPWTTYTPTLTNLTIGTGGSATTFAEYRYEGDLVHVRFNFTIGTTGPSVGTLPTFTLPVTAASLLTPVQAYPGVNSYYDVSLTTGYTGYVSAPSGDATKVRLLVPGTAGVYQPVTATAPFTWAPGDQMVGEFTYKPVAI